MKTKGQRLRVQFNLIVRHAKDTAITYNDVCVYLQMCVLHNILVFTHSWSYTDLMFV